MATPTCLSPTARFRIATRRSAWRDSRRRPTQSYRRRHARGGQVRYDHQRELRVERHPGPRRPQERDYRPRPEHGRELRVAAGNHLPHRLRRLRERGERRHPAVGLRREPQLRRAADRRQGRPADGGPRRRARGPRRVHVRGHGRQRELRYRRGRRAHLRREHVPAPSARPALDRPARAPGPRRRGRDVRVQRQHRQESRLAPQIPEGVHRPITDAPSGAAGR